VGWCPRLFRDGDGRPDGDHGDEEVTAMTIDADALRRALEPAVAALGLELYDVELTGSGRARVLRVAVQNPSDAVDLDALTEANRALGPLADDLVNGHYELEVTSPGIERTLRRPEHFRGAVGETVTIKHTATSDGAAVRERGRLVGAGDDHITFETETGDQRTVPLAAVSAARTVFEWGAGSNARPSKRAKEHTKR
jgi:ribosome maturation factor RimP